MPDSRHTDEFVDAAFRFIGQVPVVILAALPAGVPLSLGGGMDFQKDRTWIGVLLA